MRVKVDPDLCTGAAICESICPEVFEVGEDNIANVIEPEPDESLWSQVKEAAVQCPTQAIFVED